MSDLTAARDDQRQNGELIDVKMSNVKLFAGSNVNINTSGYAKKASDTASESFAGVAVETVDNSTGSAGDKSIRIWTRGVASMNCSGADQTWVGKKVYAVDDNLVALATTTTNDVEVGRVVQYVSATEVRVKY